MLFQLRKKLGGISAILWGTRFLFVPTVSLMSGIRRPRSMSFMAIPFKEIMIKSKTYSMVHLCYVAIIVATLHVYE